MARRKEMVNTNTAEGPRFTQPLYTITEAASHLHVPRSTFQTWVRGYTRTSDERQTKSGPIVSSLPKSGRVAAIPFIGLAEGMVAAAFRHAGVSMQEIRRALGILAKEIGIPHALASKHLYTDGARILFDYADRAGSETLSGLTMVASRQRVFAPVIKDYLKKIHYARDGWAGRLRLPQFDSVIVDPKRAFGQPIFEKGAVRIEDVLDRFIAGDPLRGVARDFGVPLGDVEEVIRGSLATAA